MTGIERLRAIAGAWDEWGLGGSLTEISDQIERERACDADTIENTRLIVGGVIDDMERHVSGHEGADDSPVARWARELREALGGEKCDPADFLPADEREAIAWVHEHGGLESVKKLLDLVVGHCSTEQQLDFDFWLSGRVMYELGFEEDMADRDEVERRLLARLMPEGMKWPTVDGRKVDFKTSYQPSLGVLEAVSIYNNGAVEVMSHDGIIKPVSEIHTVVLAADGEPLEAGQTVWFKTSGREMRVDKIEHRPESIWPEGFWALELFADGSTSNAAPVDVLTHQRPVLDADGVPIHVGDTVWTTRDLDKFTVTNPNNGMFLSVSCKDEGGDDYCCYPTDLTHRAPVLAGDGKPLREREHVYHVETGAELVVKGLPKPGEYQAVVVFALPTSPASHLTSFDPDQLTHTKPEPPDSWERIEEDATLSPEVYCHRNGIDISQKDGTEIFLADTVEPMARDLVRRACERVDEHRYDG